ncbi:hypothetical protein K8O92_26930 [Nocardia asteroides]|nr:hypothetical protein K8O92_26930 [Nocardia asteroides]
MTENSKLSGPEQRRIAEQALDALAQPAERVLLQVRCGRGHHVATVFDTSAGAVYRSVVGRHAHGDRDFVDTGHGAHHRGTRYVDLLAADAIVDDGLPASCECGSHTLSRAGLIRAVTSNEHTLQLR